MSTEPQSIPGTIPETPPGLPHPGEIPPVRRPRLYFEKINLIPRRPYLFWTLLGASLIVGCFICGFLTQKKELFIKTCIPLAVGITAVPFSIRFGFEVLSSWELPLLHFVQQKDESIRNWYAIALQRLEKIRLAEAVGVLLVPWALFSFESSGYFRGLSPWEGVFLGIMISLAAFSAGIAIYGLLYLAYLVWDIGKFEVRVEPHGFGIMTIGSGLVRCYVTAALIWCVISASGSWKIGNSLPPVAYIGSPALFVMVGSFLICQIPLHRRMMDFKRARLFHLDRILSELRPLQAEDLTEQRLRQLNYFEREREQVNSLPEWPFGWKSLTGVVVSALTPIIPTVLKFTVSQFLSLI
jgi:hypothetical protein